MKKTTPFIILSAVSFAAIFSKLFFLQIIKGKENQQRARENSIKVRFLSAPRGIIYDRSQKELVRNTPEGRKYTCTKPCAHLLGYIGQTDQNELKDLKSELKSEYYPFPKDNFHLLVGKSGIEKQYDQTLRGKPGGILLETNAQGEVIREIKKQQPTAGKSITLNIDLELQKKAFQLLEGRRGDLPSAWFRR